MPMKLSGLVEKVWKLASAHMPPPLSCQRPETATRQVPRGPKLWNCACGRMILSVNNWLTHHRYYQELLLVITLWETESEYADICRSAWFKTGAMLPVNPC